MTNSGYAIESTTHWIVQAYLFDKFLRCWEEWSLHVAFDVERSHLVYWSKWSYFWLYDSYHKNSTVATPVAFVCYTNVQPVDDLDLKKKSYL